MTIDRGDDGDPARQSVALATWGLFVGLALLLIGSGLFGTLVTVRAELEGFNTVVIGVVVAAYYAGFLAGSRLTLVALTRVGHVRVYAALASLLSATMLATGVAPNPITWVALRFITGLCLAGQYVVAESWLNALADNSNRGRLMAVYMLVTTGAFGIGQLLISVSDPAAIGGFVLASALTSLAVAPVALSEGNVPLEEIEQRHISLRELARIVPTGVGTCLLVGVAHGALTGMAGVYATRSGLASAAIGLFVAAPTIGGVVLQWPISSASDDVDRRAVGVVAAFGAALAAAALALTGPQGWSGVLLMALIGGASYPLYSIAVAYTNDWTPPEQTLAAASQLITLYGAGAFVGPLIVAGLMGVVGVSGFTWSIVVMQSLIGIFLTYRMRAWRAPLTKLAFSEASYPARIFFVPGTVIAASRRLRRSHLDN